MTAIQRSLAALTLGVAAGAISALFYEQVIVNQIAKNTESERPTAVSAGVIRQTQLRQALESRFSEYVANRSRHRYILLEEVVSAYMRTDAGDCLSLLRSMNALTLISSRSLAGIDSQIDLSDFATVLRAASDAAQFDRDALIADGFRELYLTDPAEAFEFLKYLPSHLRSKLASELAKSWARRDGPTAVDAFYKGADFALCSDALAAWAESDLEGAYQHLLSLDARGNYRDQLTGSFLQALAETDARAGFRLIAAHADDLPMEAQPTCLNIYKAMAAQDPEGTLKSAGSLPTDQLRRAALAGIVLSSDPSKPRSLEFALAAAQQMPVSLYSLRAISQGAADIARTNVDPFSVAEQLSDPYQFNAAVDGVTRGLVESKGMDGLSGIVRRGLSSNKGEWLDAAGSIIVAGKGAADANNINAGNWKSLPPDIAEALLSYANTNWDPEKVAALKGKLGK
jgi:hypothetical protein